MLTANDGCVTVTSVEPFPDCVPLVAVTVGANGPAATYVHVTELIGAVVGAGIVPFPQFQAYPVTDVAPFDELAVAVSVVEPPATIVVGAAANVTLTVGVGAGPGATGSVTLIVALAEGVPAPDTVAV